jgi:hypothetical protein
LAMLKFLCARIQKKKKKLGTSAHNRSMPVLSNRRAYGDSRCWQPHSRHRRRVPVVYTRSSFASSFCRSSRTAKEHTSVRIQKKCSIK